jgi:hypothetical protein
MPRDRRPPGGCRTDQRAAVRYGPGHFSGYHPSTALAAKNKFLAKSNKSQTGVKATKKRIPSKEAVSAALCVLPEDDLAKP